MKKRVLYLMIFAVLPLIFLGCGTFCGENPMGNTGGEGGYGFLNPANTMTGEEIDVDEIYGAWRHDEISPGNFEILYIMPNGTFTIYEYIGYQIDDITSGTYSYTSTHLTINIQGQGTQVCQYEFTGNTLTIHYNSGTVQYYRVTVP